jgi:hypothetical protein
MALRVALETASKDSVWLLALVTSLDALLRRQDRLERVIECAKARAPDQAPKATATLDSELVTKFVRGLLPAMEANQIDMRAQGEQSR